MEEYELEILNFLQNIKSGGEFAVSGTENFILPGLQVEGFGELAMPVTELQAQNLIKVAHKAPFGKGSQTIVDDTVRSAWEIDAQKISFSNPKWATWLDNLLKTIKDSLGLNQDQIEASLYKLLIYEKDDFFVWHKDSEKEKNMFATLVVSLPSIHQGGELAIRFAGKEKVIDFAKATSEYLFGYAAFYADCDHEVRPIKSGYRVNLVYNLLQKSSQTKLSAAGFSAQTSQLTQLLKQWSESFVDRPKIILLGHQYTPENFSLDKLKLDDLPRVIALLEAAQEADFFAHLALVTHYQQGELIEEYRPRRKKYYGYNDDDDDDVDGEMGEIYDEYLQISEWEVNDTPTLGALNIEFKDLITNINLAEGEPIEKMAEGYTGNAGMTMEYWYHYGAVVLWPKKTQAQIISRLPIAEQITWLGYYNQQSRKDSQAIQYLRVILANLNLPKAEDRYGYRGVDMSNVLLAWANIRDEEAFGQVLEDLASLVPQISPNSLLNLLNVYAPTHIAKVLEYACLRKNSYVTIWVMEFLGYLANHSLHKTFVEEQFKKIPKLLAQLPDYLTVSSPYSYSTNANNSHVGSQERMVRSLLILNNYISADQDWVNTMARLLTINVDREYLNKLVSSVLLSKDGQLKCALKTKLGQICKADLEKRVAQKPQEPTDWIINKPSASLSYYGRVWDMLADFLASPTETEFRYRKPQGERNTVESAINAVKIDLKTETIKNGSPHTLLITKTRDSYHQKLKNWRFDVKLLNDLNEAMAKED
ncbi:MAG: 2OG-Fe(II) oxygenase [Microscillaceae bacterium]|jgi:hypothetical protein|nr:2OG-Fe(II) oxygenase [Microscillaceae bacterium]